MNFQKTPNLLQNFFDIKKVFVFDTFKKKIEEITQEEFFKKYFYYVQSELKFQKLTQNNISFYNINTALRNLTYHKNSCVFETDNEIRIFIPLSILFTNPFYYVGGDFFEARPTISEKSLLIPDIDMPIDFCLERKRDNQTVKVYTTFPHFGSSIITDITTKTKEKAKDELKSVFSSIYTRLADKDYPPMYFLRYYKIFEDQEHTPLVGFFSSLNCDPLRFVDISAPKYSIMNYCYEALGRTNLASLLSANIIITQEYAHGPWTIWYDEEKQQESCDIILSVLREKFSNPNFIKFLKNLYSTEVVPYNLFEDVFTVSFKGLLYNLNGDINESDIL